MPESEQRTPADVFRDVGRRRVRALGQLDVLGVIAAGGALGSVARHLVGTAVPAGPAGMPWGTFLVNVTGCFVLGALMVFVLEVWRPSRYVRPFLGVGVLGGYTTFSTASMEAVELAGRGSWPVVAAYLLGSVVAGLAAAWLGVILARVTARRRPRRKGIEP